MVFNSMCHALLHGETCDAMQLINQFKSICAISIPPPQTPLKVLIDILNAVVYL